MTDSDNVSSHALLVDQLSFDFGGSVILKDISLKVQKGSRVLLVGANGRNF